MADEALKNLQTYTVQLEQVEAALLLDPDNEELTKLKNDLQEVILLTKNIPELNGKLQEESTSVDSGSHRQWKVGDRCSAVFQDDGQSYNALIDAITDDGLVAITYENFGNSTVVSINELKDPVESEVRSKSVYGQSSTANEKAKRKLTEQERLLAKKKKQKKFDKQKLIDEAHETDKAKWVAFTSKQGKAKKLRGLSKRSIFATPESSSGRVGIGTCGIGGKPMTEFTHGEKWRKGV